VVCQILTYLPARDLKTVRLVNRLLAKIGRENIFWSELCRHKWSERLCLETLPMPHPQTPQQSEDDMDIEKPELPTFEEHLKNMDCYEDHIFDEFKPHRLYDLAYLFPAFQLVEGSWLRAYNLVEQHMQIPYLHATVRQNAYSVSDTQWELYYPLK